MSLLQMFFCPLTSNLILPSKMNFSIFAILTIYSTVASSFATRPNDFSSYGNESSEAFARRTYFMVGGEYVFDPILNGTVKVGQMYVEKMTPQLPAGVKAKEMPIAFIHGSSQTGSVSS
jgi:hypothetical protein